LSDGQLFFETPQALVPQDTNDRDDVYEYVDGQAHLISSGRGEYGAYFGDANADGEDIYIYTANHLTPTASGENIVLYDARIGGGFPASPPPAPCVGEQCHGPTPMLPVPPLVGSVSFRGDGNVSRSGSKASFAAKSVKATGAVARLEVRVPAAGRISVAGSQVRGAHRPVSKAGSYRMSITLKSGARKRLKASSTRSLRTKVRVSFKARDGRSASKAISVTFKQPKPGRSKHESGGR
jgi:hypothetical protein